MIELFKLFLSFFQLGLFSIGGGYAVMPLMQELVVNNKGWLSIQEFSDIITISQMTPGPLAVNTATFVGIRINGTLGAIVATVGTILGGFILSIILYKFFERYKSNRIVDNGLSALKASSVGLIASASASLLLLALFNTQSLSITFSSLNVKALFLFMISLLIFRRMKTNPILIIMITGFIGLLIY